jgi:hypothetical protein
MKTSVSSATSRRVSDRGETRCIRMVILEVEVHQGVINYNKVLRGSAWFYWVLQGSSGSTQFCWVRPGSTRFDWVRSEPCRVHAESSVEVAEPRTERNSGTHRTPAEPRRTSQNPANLVPRDQQNPVEPGRTV